MPSERFFAESPENVGIDPMKLEAAFQRAKKEVREGILPSAQTAIARNGRGIDISSRRAVVYSIA